MAKQPIIPLTKNKQGQLNKKQHICNSKAEVQRIEGHQEILQDVGVYHLVQINRYLSMNQARILCARDRARQVV